MTTPWKQYLGRELRDEERGIVEVYNELDDMRLIELRELATHGTMLAVAYLRHVVRKSDASAAADFVKESVIGGADHRTWGFRDQLCSANGRIGDLLTLTATRILDPLATVQGERWLRMVPSLGAWFRETTSPGVLRRAVPYWERCAGGCTCYLLSPLSSPLEPVDDVVTEVRRSLASMAARAIAGTGLRPRGIDDIASALMLEPATLSADGIAALQGLVTELRDGLTPWFDTWKEWRTEIDTHRDALPPGYRASPDAYR